MLKRLELVGFKSFADKTQFDFSEGITAIVGPNGSGKSNVVDAVRWILGEQSAKSLRGGEMADVIFNGSTSRRGLGLAEVTMTFDNQRRLLATDAADVQITRRVYRDGEGEYLINNQISRLRDIKELFLGSGAGTDAYCIIEQGRVDVLLQASTRDRRVIFEEAAGISRFKAKKIETLRRLERVDQNLERLKDIVEEVEKQLRSVKLQASKAQRYQEYSNRLKELRLLLGLEEYHQLTERLRTEAEVLRDLQARLAERTAQAESCEAEARRLEETLARLEAHAHEQESLLATAREKITAETTTLDHEWSLSSKLEADLLATRSQMAALDSRVAELASGAAAAAAELGNVEAQHDTERQQVAALEGALAAAVAQLGELRGQVQADHARHLDEMRRAAHLHNEVTSIQAHTDNLRRERDRLLHRTEQAAEHLATLDVEVQDLAHAEEALQGRLGETRQTLAAQRAERDRLRQACDERAKTVAQLRERRTGLASRIEVLEGLEQSHEGLGTGVRELVSLLAAEKDQTTSMRPALREVVLGMVADFLTVRREYAPLIDLVLGERAQQFLVRDRDRLAKQLAVRTQPFTGRISFVPIAPMSADAPWSDTANAHPGIIGCAEAFVTCDHPELALLVPSLFRRTIVVRDLDTAQLLAPTLVGYQFITLRGELLQPDGTLTIGSHHAETGILSRKSELRELRESATECDMQIAAADADLLRLRDEAAALESKLSGTQEEIDVLAEQATDLRSRLTQRRQTREGLHEEVTLSRSEISGVETDLAKQEEALCQAKSQAAQADREVQNLQQRLMDAEQAIRQGEHERQRFQQEVTTAKVGLATTSERLAALRARHRQAQQDLEQRRKERQQGEDRLAAARARIEESGRTMLAATSALAEWYLRKEDAERQATELVRARDEHRLERQGLAARAQAARGEWQTHQEQAHARELVVNDMRHHRDSIADRLREDYQVNLAELYEQALHEGRFADAVELPIGDLDDEDAQTIASSDSRRVDAAVINEEISELRRKLSRLGSVNLDSLQELAELESRAANLQTQANDLTSAKSSLEEIIAEINRDSRRLFTETFASIRTHFQELFRKLFGGGMADIVLEDENDILESGIEIIARPPGKELRSISLMSGGEKTLTAVALLLAIFRSKPSPFCILDEVDAALDEANIGRFTAVLRDFLDQSQFIIITHSKRTMAVADVLYGITMQESGVSKRVAVRFEDWLENGQAEATHASVDRNGD